MGAMRVMGGRVRMGMMVAARTVRVCGPPGLVFLGRLLARLGFGDGREGRCLGDPRRLVLFFVV